MTQFDTLDAPDSYKFEISKIQDGGGRHLEKSRYRGCGSSDFDEIWHTDALITTCSGIDQAGKAGIGVLHATQLIGHAARLLYLLS